MSYNPDKLYNLLPAVHRIRYVEEGEPLLSCSPHHPQVASVGGFENLRQPFIETCAPWVLPYIGDLIGYRSLPRSGLSM